MLTRAQKMAILRRSTRQCARKCERLHGARHVDMSLRASCFIAMRPHRAEEQCTMPYARHRRLIERQKWSTTSAQTPSREEDVGGRRRVMRQPRVARYAQARLSRYHRSPFRRYAQAWRIRARVMRFIRRLIERCLIVRGDGIPYRYQRASRVVRPEGERHRRHTTC